MKRIFKTLLLLSMSLLSLHVYAGDMTAFVDPLYWHASEETASIWASTYTTSGNDEKYAVDNIHFDSNPGIRAGLRYSPDGHYWDTRLYFTHFSADDKLSYPADGQLIFPQFFSGFFGGNCFFVPGLPNCFFAADAKWKLTMNTIDLDASHEYKATKSLTIRPSIGVKAAAIDQDIDVNWNEEIFISKEDVKHDFTGIGPSFGIDVTWNFYKELNLASDLSGALLWGNWNVKDTYTRPALLDGLVPSSQISTHMDDNKLGVAMLDYFLGVEWLHESDYELALKLGYEMQYWQNQLRLTTFQQLPTHGDLTLQGVTCGISIKF
ncbi:MAG: hypothetical protein CMF50_01270 [Legionellales bacterium]|nr:hypothetical protein [Legionellales bacterium]|tara:strand:+ start:469 stop:1434 length:966 start_codon:yes stop_codon:yes gene_type:complete